MIPIRHIISATIVLTSLNIYAQLTLPKPKEISIGRSFEVYSKVLEETRVLNIYMPYGYAANDNQRYDVIYLLDGGVDEDFIHTAGIVQFTNLPWIEELPRYLVVGIANTDRKRDMTFSSRVESEKTRYPTSGGSDQFIRFLKEEVVPLVEAHFQTSGNDYLIGQSLAGLLVTEILFTQPQIFDNYIIISPSLWWDDGSMLSRELQERSLAEKRIYLAVGREGLTPSEKPRVMDTDVHLLAEKLDQVLGPDQLFFDFLPKENHATITHQAVYNAIRWMAALKHR